MLFTEDLTGFYAAVPGVFRRCLGVREAHQRDERREIPTVGYTCPTLAIDALIAPEEAMVPYATLTVSHTPAATPWLLLIRSLKARWLFAYPDQLPQPRGTHRLVQREWVDTHGE